MCNFARELYALSRNNTYQKKHFISHFPGSTVCTKGMKKLSIMKHKFIVLAKAGVGVMLLLLLMLVGVTQAKAQETYGLKIAGIDVTSENCNDLTRYAGVGGTVKYDPSTNILTLDNATIALQGNTEGITNYANNGLVINISGENKITSNLSALSLSQSTTIKGDGTLDATSNNESGIAIANGTLTVTPCTVNAKGVYGISGDSENSTLAVNIGATVTAQGSKGSLVGMEALDLDSVIDIVLVDGVAITKPSRAVFDKDKKAVVVNGVTTTQKVVIEKLVFYGLFINGEKVTNANCDDLSVVEDVSGAVVFDPNTFTLTFKNAVIYTEKTGFAIRYDGYSPNLTINLLGENNIITYGSPLGVTYDQTTFTGGGTLKILTASAMQGNNLIFDDCTVSIKSYDYSAIRGVDTDRASLTIRNADITAELMDTTETYGSYGTYATIAREKSITLEGCEIAQPTGAAFNESLNAIALDGKRVKSKIIIKNTTQKYGFKVAGIDVNSLNCNDLTVIPNVSGSVKYNPETKTLSLENATIEASGDVKGIDCESTDDLIINVTGDNTIKAKHSAMMLNKAPTVIKGYGTLNAEAERGVGLYFNNSLEIDDCTANFSGNWGLMGREGKCEKLTVNNATVTMTGVESSHSDLYSLSLINSVISTPEGAAFSDALHAIALNGKAVTSSIVISPDTTKRYDVVLEECTENKEEVVALVQEITGLGEAESEALVDSAPCIISSDVTPDEAHDICHKLAKLNCAANDYPHDTWAPTGIQGIKDATVAGSRQGIYSINGVYLGHDYDSLPNGVYIKDGKKVLK